MPLKLSKITLKKKTITVLMKADLKETDLQLAVLHYVTHIMTFKILK